LGRRAISVLAVVALRAQEGLEAQCESHLIGLRKCEGLEEEEEGEEEDIGDVERWMSEESGCEWLLLFVDEVKDDLSGSSSTW
jgi:hypothetical protein